MNKFFKWIFLPCDWMNYWMNQKSALFIGKMNKKCLFRTEWPLLPVFHCFLKLWFVFQFEWIILLKEYFWFNFEWIILLNEYSWFNFELNIELNHFLARFNVKMNNQNLSATPTPSRDWSCYWQTSEVPRPLFVLTFSLWWWSW